MAAESGDSVRTPRNDPAWLMDRQGSVARRSRGVLRDPTRVSEVIGEGVIKMIGGDKQKVCEVCGEEFIASRRDAKTCSVGCKQKAYRRRKREVKLNK